MPFIRPNAVRLTQIRNILNPGVTFPLFRLMNRLLKAAGAPTVVYRTKAPTSFVALANIESFVAAVRAYGVTETSLFQPADLYEGRKGPLLYVLNCLDQLGKLVSLAGTRTSQSISAVLSRSRVYSSFRRRPVYKCGYC